MQDPTRRSVLRGLSAAAVAALTGLGTTSCARRPEPVGPGPTDPDFGSVGSGTINFWARADTGPVPTEMVRRFNEAQSEIRVELTLMPGTQQITKIATAIRGDSQPDVFAVDDFYATALTYYKALTDVTEAVGRLPFRNELSSGMQQTVQLEGRSYGVPFASDMSGLWYNKALFTRADLDPEKPPTSFEAVVAAAKKITAAGGGTARGFSFAGNCPGCMSFTGLPSVWAGGEHLVEGEPGDQRANLAGNEPLREILMGYRDLWTSGNASQSSRTESGATWGADFRNGRVGILPGGYGTVVGQVPDEQLATYGLVPLPGPTGGTSTFTGGDVIGIPAGARNPSAAWKFIQFTLAEAQQLALPAIGFTPVRSDVLTPEYREEYPLNAVLLGLQDVGYIERSVAAGTIFNQPSGAWPSTITEAVFGGGVDTALRRGQDQAQSALAEVNL